MEKCQMKSSLDGTEKWLIKNMQKMRFGKVGGIHVKDGKPLRNPAPMFARSRKHTKKPDTRTRQEKVFALKSQITWLLAEMADVSNGVIMSVTVQDGLPVLVDWEPRTEL